MSENITPEEVAKMVARFEEISSVESVRVYGNGTMVVQWKENRNANFAIEEATEKGMVVKSVDFESNEIRLIFNN